jgi:Na+/melibiose symporter-like transporter
MTVLTTVAHTAVAGEMCVVDTQHRTVFVFMCLCAACLYVAHSVTVCTLYHTARYDAFTMSLSHTAVPYAALTTELSDDYDERTSLTMWRVGAGEGGTEGGGACM